MTQRLPLALLAMPALAVARLLPAHGVGLGLRLTAATACLLLPGALAARALRLRSAAATVALALAALFVAMLVTFALHRSLWFGFAALCALALAALPFAFRRQEPLRPWLELGMLALGIAFGVALWHVASLDGDAFFHLGRIRKLDALGSLSLENVGEFRGGGLHPGYAFPLWHAFLALVARLADVDAIAIVRHEPTVLLPLSIVLWFEAGAALFRSGWAGVAAALPQAALIGLAAGHGGAYTWLALPATAARQLVLPAALALAFGAVREPKPARVAATALAALALVLVHPTYALFLCIPFGGFVVARALLAGREILAGPAALAALALPTLGYLLWLRPVVDETTTHNPSQATVRSELAQYAGQIDGGTHHYRLAAELFTRGGAVAVAALVLVPLAVLAARRRWAAYVLGGSLLVFVLTLLPSVFPWFADLVSVSQARRAVGFLPFAFAIAGGAAVLAAVLRLGAPAAGLAGGILLQLAYPGDFGYHFGRGTPSWPTWIAAVGGAAALVLGVVVRRWGSLDRAGPIAALATALFVLPVAVHGFRRWSPRPSYGEVSSGLIHAVRAHARPRDVLFADSETGYVLAGYAPVYLVDAPLSHVADTTKNRPRSRLHDAYLFFSRHGDLAAIRKYRPRWIVIDLRRHRLRPDLPRVYADRRYVLYRLR